MAAMYPMPGRGLEETTSVSQIVLFVNLLTTTIIEEAQS